METIENYKSLGIEAKVSNPKFYKITVEGEVDGNIEKRDVVLCQVTATIDLFGDGDKVYCSDMGISIRNPEDDDGELGKEIAYGRAIKNPMISVSLTSNRRLPKPIINEQIVWAKKHVERNLDNYVNNLRETLKNQ